jgi:hypothetical protein
VDAQAQLPALAAVLAEILQVVGHCLCPRGAGRPHLVH